MARQFIQATLEYQWEPFTLRGRHLTFKEHIHSRLERAYSSHWGPAVYRWKGEVRQGPCLGRIGVLIGETSDLRHRIKQYISGTQKRGNKLWRETFLNLGDIRLDILTVHNFYLFRYEFRGTCLPTRNTDVQQSANPPGAVTGATRD